MEKITRDFSGSTSVALSSDGSDLAVGAPYNDDENGLEDSGHVCVYGNENGSWKQIGDDMYGENENDHSDSSVALSSDGSVLAVAAYRNDRRSGLEDSGHVRVYRNENGSWKQEIGDDVYGENEFDYSGNNTGSAGRSVALSDDGSVLAVGAVFNDENGSDSGHVRV